MTTTMTVVERIGRPRASAGFTLIELMAALAVISVFGIGFLPAVQRARESANRTAAAVTLTQVAARLQDFHKQFRRFPASLGELRTQLPGVALQSNGYRLGARQMDSASLKLVFEPVPGVTGSETGVLEMSAGAAGVSQRIAFIPSPGADEGRRALLNAVSTATVRAFGQILGTELPAVQKTAVERIRDYMDSPVTPAQVFDTLRGRDGTMTLASVREYLQTHADVSIRTATAEYWESLARAMQLGANDENWTALAGFRTPPSIAAGDSLLTLPRTAALTAEMVSDAQLRTALNSALSAAAKAEAAGDLAGRKAALANYIALLDAQQALHFGRGLTQPVLPFGDAAALMAVAGSL